MWCFPAATASISSGELRRADLEFGDQHIFHTTAAALAILFRLAASARKPQRRERGIDQVGHSEVSHVVTREPVERQQWLPILGRSAGRFAHNRGQDTSKTSALVLLGT